MTNGGVYGFPAKPAASIAPFGAVSSGRYYYASGQFNASTNAASGVGTLRLVPWLVATDITISQLGAEVTVTGDSGSKVRLGVYADFRGYPGALLLDAGQIAGDSATVQDLAVSLSLSAGLYWVGGAVQTVTTTQPTIRTTTQPALIPLNLGTSTPSAGVTSIGFSTGSVTGALPAAYSSTISAAGTAPRVHFKVA